MEVLPWYVVEPFLRQFIELDDAFFYIIVLILFIVISVGILNTVMMSVFERVREFGVMMALGTKPRQVVRLVVQEAAVLALLGAALGALLGSASTIAFAYTGINLSRYAAGASALGITTTVIHPELTSRNLIVLGSLRGGRGAAGGFLSGHQSRGPEARRGHPAHLSEHGADRTHRRFEDLPRSRRGARADRR